MDRQFPIDHLSFPAAISTIQSKLMGTVEAISHEFQWHPLSKCYPDSIRRSQKAFVSCFLSFLWFGKQKDWEGSEALSVWRSFQKELILKARRFMITIKVFLSCFLFSRQQQPLVSLILFMCQSEINSCSFSDRKMNSLKTWNCIFILFLIALSL